MDKVILDLADRPFLPKIDIFMLYVALTRVRHGQNIRILPMPHRASDKSGYMKTYSHISVLRFPGMLMDYLCNIQNNHGLFNEVSMRARIEQVHQFATKKYGAKKRTITDAYKVKDTAQYKPCKTMADRRPGAVQFSEKPQHSANTNKQIPFRLGMAAQTDSGQRVPQLEVWICESQKYPFKKSSIDSCRVHEYVQDDVIDTLLQVIPNMINSQTNTYVLCANMMISNLLNNYNKPDNGWIDGFRNPCINQICDYEPSDTQSDLGLPRELNMKLSALFAKYNVVMSIPINIPGQHFYALVVKSDRHMVTFEVRDSLSSPAGIHYHHNHHETIVTNACKWITAFCNLRCPDEYSLAHVPRQTETECAFHTVQNCLNVCRESVGDDIYNNMKTRMLRDKMWPKCLGHVLTRQTFIQDLIEKNEDGTVRRMKLHESKATRLLFG